MRIDWNDGMSILQSMCTALYVSGIMHNLNRQPDLPLVAQLKQAA